MYESTKDIFNAVFQPPRFKDILRLQYNPSDEFNPKDYILCTEPTEYKGETFQPDDPRCAITNMILNEKMYGRVKTPRSISKDTNGKYTFTISRRFDIFEGFVFAKKTRPSCIIFRDEHTKEDFWKLDCISQFGRDYTTGEVTVAPGKYLIPSILTCFRLVECELVFDEEKYSPPNEGYTFHTIEGVMRHSLKDNFVDSVFIEKFNHNNMTYIIHHPKGGYHVLFGTIDNQKDFDPKDYIYHTGVHTLGELVKLGKIPDNPKEKRAESDMIIDSTTSMGIFYGFCFKLGENKYFNHGWVNVNINIPKPTNTITYIPFPQGDILEGFDFGETPPIRIVLQSPGIEDVTFENIPRVFLPGKYIYPHRAGIYPHVQFDFIFKEVLVQEEYSFKAAIGFLDRKYLDLARCNLYETFVHNSVKYTISSSFNSKTNTTGSVNYTSYIIE